MEQAKKEYDAAKALCENLPAGPEKTQACQKMDAARAKYLAAQSELNAIKAEKDRLVGEVANLITDITQF